jgi:sigma-B regulation protein RsbU (phosphoserine phosphatase)
MPDIMRHSYFNNYQTISLDKGCTLLGIMSPLLSLETETLLVPLNSILFAYTDGLTDTINNSDETISIDEIKNTVTKNKLSSCEFINKAMLFYLEEFKAEMPFIDDIAMLTCKFK